MEDGLPRCLRDLLDADLAELARAPMPVLALLTVQPDGWPHVAYLGPGELIARSGSELSLATWAGSRSTAAAVRTGKVTLQTAIDGVPVLVRLAVRERTTTEIGGRQLCLLDGEAIDSITDGVSYAALTSGTTFTVHDPAAALARWEQIRTALRGVRNG